MKRNLQVYTGKFHPGGDILASSGFDRQIFLWKVYGEGSFASNFHSYLSLGECENVSVMSGHTGAVVQLKFSPDGDTIYTASTDKTVCT